MSPELSVDPPDIGRHGRLSREYAQASQNSEQHASEPLELADRAGGRPADVTEVADVQSMGVSGRLGSDYRQAVVELERNPAAFFRVVLDERFDRDSHGWPHDPLMGALRIVGGYRLMPATDDQFLAIRAPVGSSLRDVQVGATFRKLGGPAGGVFGLLLRDYGPEARDGPNQARRYYVAQVDDQGDVGIWRLEQDRWVELVPWTPCTAVRPGQATNDVSFEMVGGRLTVTVNGYPAASAHDAALDNGGVGLFVAGNGNDVLVERFVVHALS